MLTISAQTRSCIYRPVSEETGGIAVAYMGTLYRDLDEDSLRKHLQVLQDKTEETRHRKPKRGGVKNEE